MLINDYIKQQAYYESIYGKKVVVFMEVGNFYEIYGIDTNMEKIGDVQTIANLCNIIFTKKRKTNYLNTSFPIFKLNEYLDILLKENYTIVMYNEISLSPNPERAVIKIHIPSIYNNKINYFL